MSKKPKDHKNMRLDELVSHIYQVVIFQDQDNQFTKLGEPRGKDIYGFTNQMKELIGALSERFYAPSDREHAATNEQEG